VNDSSHLPKPEYRIPPRRVETPNSRANLSPGRFRRCSGSPPRA
jgi:hypothetical protein